MQEGVTPINVTPAINTMTVCKQYFLLYQFIEISFENHINVLSNVVIRRFRHTGIIVDGSDTTVIRNSFMTDNNENCISLNGETYAVRLINNTLINNGDPSTETSSSAVRSSVYNYVSFYAHGNIVHDNSHWKVFKFSIRTAVARSVIEITNNKVVNNTCENVVEVEHASSSCLPNTVHKVVLANNIWKNNQVRSSSVKLMRFRRCYSSQKRNILITDNEFSNNTCNSLVNAELERSTNVILNSNFLSKNILEKSAIIIVAQYHAGDISLLFNQIFNNTAEILVDITGNTLLLGNSMEHNEVDKSIFNFNSKDSNNQNKFNLTQNGLFDNINRFRPRLVSAGSVIENAAAIICSSRQISFHQNFFHNPLFAYEVAITPVIGAYEIDGKYNWWGAKDEAEIMSRIFDFRWRNFLVRLNFSPFLGSANLSDIIYVKNTFGNYNGSILGGAVIDDHIILKKANSPYTVIKDVIIYPNATLTVEPGVQIDVSPYIEFHVYGKLELLGKLDNQIKFDLTSFFTGYEGFTAGAHYVRLVNGSKPWEGIVEIFYNNTWGTVCDDGYSRYSNGFVLCKQLGYVGYISRYSYTSSSDSTKPVWLKNLRCNRDIHHDISSCSFEGWGVSCSRGIWTVSCDPGFWRGIRFRESAKPSRILHVKFERGGGTLYGINNYVLHFDVLRQTLADIEIQDSSFGIKISLLKPGLVLSNMLIKNLKKSRGGQGIECSSPLKCYNCTVYSKNTAFFFSEFNIADFISESVKHVDSLAVPWLNFRKEIPMCEQNASVVVDKGDFKIVSMLMTNYYSEEVECFLTLVLVAQTTLIAAEMPLQSSETFSISSLIFNSSNSTNFTINQGDVYTFEPGELTLRYWRNRYSWGSRKRFVLFSLRGKYLFNINFTTLEKRRENYDGKK